jgi:hypothetical protein
MPSDQYSIKTKRTKKDDKAKRSFELNGKFSNKHLRNKEELMQKTIIREQSKK